jgi:hypothetical protein
MGIVLAEAQRAIMWSSSRQQAANHVEAARAIYEGGEVR